MEELYPDTEPTKVGIVRNITHDSSVQACICDLIDNSIDAWHTNKAEDNERPRNKFNILTDFSGLEIEVVINEERVSVSDNGPGIPSDSIEESALRFGATSQKKAGIGLFGVGLNRAIFKIGGIGLIESRSHDEECLVELDVEKYAADKDDWTISASAKDYSGPTGTRVEITNPNSHALRFLGKKSKVEGFVKSTQEIYAQFIERGLTLNINGAVLSAKFIALREDSPFPTIKDELVLPTGTTIIIEAGQHGKHRFSAEPKKRGHTNNGLSPEFGWSIYCNDRAIILRNRESKTGWDQSWHSEYNGFVGSVSFYANNPENLPFNTSKTDLVLTHEAYEEALEMMAKAVKTWVHYGRIAKSYKKEGKELLPNLTEGIDQPEEPDEPSDPDNPVEPTIIRPRKDWMILPADIDKSRCDPKLASLVVEAQTTKINKRRYTSLALMRMLFEVAAQDYLIDIGQFKTLKKQKIQERNDVRKARGEARLTPSEKKALDPTLSDMVKYLLSTADVFGEDVGTHLERSLQDFQASKGMMDSAIHHARRKIAIDRVEGIRDEILPILKHLIERPNVSKD